MSDPPALPGVRHDHVDAGGVRTHVALAGPDDAPPVLLVHGWPQNWWVWRHVIPALADRFRVIAPDLRGHGWSAAPAAGYDKEQLGSDMLAVLDALGVERATWVGHDWGGWSGLLAALRAPAAHRAPARAVRAAPVGGPPPAAARRAAGLPDADQPAAARPRASRARPRARCCRPAAAATASAPPTSRCFADHIPPRVTVAMYRTNLVREALPILRGRYADARLAVPTTLMVGAPGRHHAGPGDRARRGAAEPARRGPRRRRALGARAAPAGRDRLGARRLIGG